MKKCPYCGTEYPDEATVCVIDTETLLEHPPKPKVEDEPPPAAEPAREEPHLAYPEYQWRAKDAWKCLLALFCLGFIVLGLTGGLSVILGPFYQSGPGFIFLSLLTYPVDLSAVAYFARTKTLATFWKGLGLDQKPTNAVWFGIVMVLLIRFASHFMIVHHWGHGVHLNYLHEFRNSLGWQRYLFMVPAVILAPLFEEPIYRGFLYRAFRGSYGIAVSMLLNIAWVCNTHWTQYIQSWIAALALSAFTVVQCYLREKSRSLWDCVVCHFVFNASNLF